jgi:uncharacterized ion transporter superfamily protein YfcC
MINRSRSRHVLLIAGGFLLLLLGIVELITDNHVDNIVVTSFGIYLIVANGYVYLRPSTTSSTRALLAALGGFLLCFVVAFLVFHRYSQAGLFSTFGSTFDVLWVIIWLVMSIWFVYRYFSLRGKEQK